MANSKVKAWIYNRKVNLVRSQFVFQANNFTSQLIYGTKLKKQFNYISVDPKKIKYCNKSRYRIGYVTSKPEYFHQEMNFSNKAQYKTMTKRIVQKLPWNECVDPYYFEMMSKTYELKLVLAERLSVWDRIIKDINDGATLKTNIELNKPAGIDEILVNIGKNGELIKVIGTGGAHRLSIAKILKISSVPVLVGAVHLNALQTGIFSEYQDHESY